jgi:hypothetical protein
LRSLRRFGFIALVLAIGGWATAPRAAETRVLESALQGARERPALARILAQPQRFEVQIRWTRVIRDGAGWRTQTEHFGVDPNRWFAAASLVKLPLAIMALEQLKDLDLPRASRIQSSMPEGCAAVAARADTPPAAEAITRTLQRLLLVSDNEAFNRLYQWLGPPLPQQRFRKMGFARAHITRPLMVCDDASRAKLGAWTLSNAAGEPLAQADLRSARDRPVFDGAPVLKGKAWMEGGQRQPGPHDFSDSNYLPLALLERELMSVVRPDLLQSTQRSRMREVDRLWLRQTLGSTPADSPDPAYPVEQFPVYYAKSLLVGDGRPWPSGVRIYNKVGESYGYLSDVAYIEDEKNDFGFFLSAVVYVDLDGTLNDGVYAYDALGRPYLAELGQLLLQTERRLRGVAQTD